MQGPIALADLRLVLAIGSAGSLTGAARDLAVDHSTAFRRLGALEARLGARLFERAREGYVPTTAGEAAIAAARRVLEELDTLEQRLAGEDLRPAGVVRVTTTDTLLELLAPLLVDFRSAHPEITVEVVAANAFFTLTRRDAEVAIRPAVAVPDHLVGRRIATLAMAPYAARAYLRRHGERPELASHDWLGLDDSLAHLASAKWMRDQIPQARVVARANSLLALRAAAAAGMGVAALPCYLADLHPNLTRVRPPVPEMASALWLLTHPDLRRVARIRAFMDFAAEWLARRRNLIEGRAGGPEPPQSRGDDK